MVRGEGAETMFPQNTVFSVSKTDGSGNLDLSSQFRCAKQCHVQGPPQKKNT